MTKPIAKQTESIDVTVSEVDTQQAAHATLVTLLSSKAPQKLRAHIVTSFSMYSKILAAMDCFEELRGAEIATYNPDSIEIGIAAAVAKADSESEIVLTCYPKDGEDVASYAFKKKPQIDKAKAEMIASALLNENTIRKAMPIFSPQEFTMMATVVTCDKDGNRIRIVERGKASFASL